MGMDLIPIAPSQEAPRYPWNYKHKSMRGKAITGRYNWSGWGALMDFLSDHGWDKDDMSEFAGTNDGYVISDATCKKVADTIEKFKVDYTAIFVHGIDQDIQLWRTCGGYEQW
jgi:hypothetical protein